MELSGWHIDGYGVFADHEVEELTSGLTIVHGPNEAGKSTLLDFLRDMLFGFADRRHRRPMHEPLRGGRHGGTLGLRDGEGVAWRLERHAGKHAPTLTGPGGALGGEVELRQLLGGVDAEVFRNVFAFGLGELATIDSLERDEIRELVFSAGVLGAGRSATKAIQALADGQARIVRPRRQDALANSLRKRVDDIDAELRALRAAALAYPTRARLVATLAAGAVEARETIDDLRRQLSDLNQLESCWPVFVAHREALRVLSTLPALSEGETRLLDAASSIDELARAGSGHDERVERLEKVRLELDEVREAIVAELAPLGGNVTLDEAVAFAVDLELRERVRGLAADEPLARGRAISAQEQLTTAKRAYETAQAVVLERVDSVGPVADASELERVHNAVLELRDCVRDRDAIETERLVAEQRDHLARLAQPTRPTRAIAIGVFAAGIAIGALVALDASHLAGGAIVAGGISLLLVVLGGWLFAAGSSHRVVTSDFPPMPVGPSSRVDADRLCRRIGELAAICGTDTAPSIGEVDAVLRRNEEQRTRRNAITECERSRDDAAVRVRDADEQLGETRTRLAEIIAATTAVASDLHLAATSGARAVSDALDRFSTVRELQRRCLGLEAAEATIEIAEKHYLEAVESLAMRTEVPLGQASDSRALIDGLERRVGELADRAHQRRSLTISIEGADGELARGRALVRDQVWFENELELGDSLAWTRLRVELAGQLSDAEKSYEDRLGTQRDAERELEELETSDRVASLGLQAMGFEEELTTALERYAVLGCAKALVEQTLARYERERQPIVIARAAALFANVTDGRYLELVARADPDGGRSQGIEAINARGERVDSADLSRGAAEQLYLCLRLSLAMNFAGGSVRLPLILDDILVNFDPLRAKAVARVIGEVAADHQVLAFTCHPHVVEVLSNVTSATRVVELERRS